MCWAGCAVQFTNVLVHQKLESNQPHDDWELDPRDIELSTKVASGAFGDLYKGTYCGQDVAIKILRNVQDDSQQYQEFLQVRHTYVAFVLCARVLTACEIVC